MVEIPQNTHQFDDGADEPLPPGEYLCEIESILCKTSQRSGSDYLSVKFAVLHGEHQGRSVYTNLNLWHANQKAQYYAQMELKDICQALRLDRETVNDTDELEGKSLIVKVVHQTSGDRTYINTDGYKPKPKGSTQPRGAAVKTDGPDDIPW